MSMPWDSDTMYGEVIAMAGAGTYTFNTAARKFINQISASVACIVATRRHGSYLIPGGNILTLQKEVEILTIQFTGAGNVGIIYGY